LHRTAASQISLVLPPNLFPEVILFLSGCVRSIALRPRGSQRYRNAIFASRNSTKTRSTVT